VIRHHLGLPEIQDDAERHTNLGYDILSPAGVKIDIKCRGGKWPFEEYYAGTGSILREAKHNFFARQVYDDALNTDIYLMAHLRVAGKGELPGTERQRNWLLYVCGWVSKKRVKREGVYLPRGSLTEQGSTWFAYRAQEIEFFHRNLNQLTELRDVLRLTADDVAADERRSGHYNLTKVDAVRIAMDLFARGLLTSEQVRFVKAEAGITVDVEPILNINQYVHLAEWLFSQGQITRTDLGLIKAKFPVIEYAGI
jgi:hypothetical protein